MRTEYPGMANGSSTMAPAADSKLKERLDTAHDPSAT
jgi:hypothetical protein